MKLKTDNKVKIMFDSALLEALLGASKRSRMSVSEIARRSIRRYRKLSPDLSGYEAVSTTGGEPRDIQLMEVEPLDPELMRRVIRWGVAMIDATEYTPKINPIDLAIFGGVNPTL